ncbi:MAG: ABC transporter ATP-binding protein/permease, partial [Methanimicrococcus sp.]|nr:ABC transporter ATP-binding protein/permease [Methanimicrococcus sp.]
PFLLIFIFFVSRKIIPLMKMIQEKLDSLSRVLRSRLTGVRVIRAFNKEKAANRQYEEANTDLTNVSLTVSRIMAIVFPGMSFLMNIAVVAVLWFGSWRITIDTFSVGDLMAFIQYVFLIMFSVVMLSMIFIIIPRAKVSMDRILEILNTDESLHDYSSVFAENEPRASFERINVAPIIEFKNVSFRYSDSDNDILTNLSFQVPCGETVAIIGGTGSGKTSMVNLIPRFYDVSAGSVFVNGKDVRSYSQADLRHKIGFVPQTAILFSGTVAENIRYGKEDATDDEIWQALEIAQAADFVKQMDFGLNSPISQEGTNVSGGQKQRLTIARAIVGKPEIYVFDDNFSALDYKTDALLRKALKTELRDSTIIIVAQRISTIKNVSQIIVLDKGEIVGIGTDAELMQKSAVYRQIVASQTAEEGLHESK